jgi:hypothetical protein
MESAQIGVKLLSALLRKYPRSAYCIGPLAKVNCASAAITR